MIEIIDFNNEKFVINRRYKVFDNKELVEKIKFNTGSNVVLHKDGIYYFCQHIIDAKYVDIKEENNDIKEQSEIPLVDSSISSDNQAVN